jgi:hypothetical protein
MKHFMNRKFAEKIRLRNYIQWNLEDNDSDAWVRSNKAPGTVLGALIGAVFLDARKKLSNIRSKPHFPPHVR